MGSPHPVLRPAQPHIHLTGALCPVCDQPIPNEKAEQVQTRIEARDRAAAEAVTLRMKEQFAAERTLPKPERTSSSIEDCDHVAQAIVVFAEKVRRRVAELEAQITLTNRLEIEGVTEDAPPIAAT